MLGALWATVACAQPYALIRLDVPEGMVIPPAVDVNLSELASVLGVPPPERWEPVCALESGDGHLTALLTQFDPGPDFDATTVLMGDSAHMFGGKGALIWSNVCCDGAYTTSPLDGLGAGGVPVNDDTASRHNGGENFGFADGHVKWVQPRNAMNDAAFWTR